MATQLYPTMQEARQAAARAGYTEWTSGTGWLPIMQFQSAGNTKRCWFNPDKRRIGGVHADGTCFSFPIR